MGAFAEIAPAVDHSRRRWIALAAVTFVAAVTCGVIVESAPRAAADQDAEIGEELALEAAA